MMNDIPVMKYNSLDEAVHIIANELEKMVQKTLKNKKMCSFGLVGGRSVSNIYKQIIKNNIDYKRVNFYLLDERLVESSNNESNYHLINNSLFGPLLEAKKINNENIKNINYNQILQPEDMITDYNSQLKATVYNFCSVDVAIISVGEDGHIASIFPDHDSFYDTSDFFILVKNAPKKPSNRISASKKMLSGINHVILLFFGNSKKNALQNFLKKSYDDYLCPARILKNIPDIKIFTDINL